MSVKTRRTTSRVEASDFADLTIDLDPDAVATAAEAHDSAAIVRLAFDACYAHPDVAAAKTRTAANGSLVHWSRSVMDLARRTANAGNRLHLRE